MMQPPRAPGPLLRLESGAPGGQSRGGLLAELAEEGGDGLLAVGQSHAHLGAGPVDHVAQ